MPRASWTPSLAILAISSLCACNADLVGDEIGTYRVTMKLKENTCGGAVIEQDGAQYTVQIRADGARGYWRLPGKPLTEGRYDNDTFRFGISSVADQSAEGAEVFCQILQDELLTGSVTFAAMSDAGSPDRDAGDTASADEAGLSGEHVLTFRATDDSDCSAALVSVGGGYERLPCSVRYSLEGTPTGSF